MLLCFNKPRHITLDHGNTMSWTDTTEGQFWQSKQERNDWNEEDMH